MRPLCNGNIGSNAAVATVTSLLIRPMKRDAAKKQGTSICSTEELKHSIMEANMSGEEYLRQLQPQRPGRACLVVQSGTLVVGSMDWKSLYPNCKLREASQHIRDTMKLGLTD